MTTKKTSVLMLGGGPLGLLLGTWFSRNLGATSSVTIIDPASEPRHRFNPIGPQFVWHIPDGPLAELIGSESLIEPQQKILIQDPSVLNEESNIYGDLYGLEGGGLIHRVLDYYSTKSRGRPIEELTHDDLDSLMSGLLANKFKGMKAYAPKAINQATRTFRNGTVKVKWVSGWASGVNLHEHYVSVGDQRIYYDYLISTMPLASLLKLCELSLLWEELSNRLSTHNVGFFEAIRHSPNSKFRLLGYTYTIGCGKNVCRISQIHDGDAFFMETFVPIASDSEIEFKVAGEPFWRVPGTEGSRIHFTQNEDFWMMMNTTHDYLRDVGNAYTIGRGGSLDHSKLIHNAFDDFINQVGVGIV